MKSSFERSNSRAVTSGHAVEDRNGWEAQLGWLLEDGDNELPGENELVELLTSALCRPAATLIRRRSLTTDHIITKEESSLHSRGALNPKVAKRLLHPSGHVDIAGSAMAWAGQLRGSMDICKVSPLDAPISGISLRRSSTVSIGTASNAAASRNVFRRRASVSDTPSATAAAPRRASFLRRLSLSVAATMQDTPEITSAHVQGYAPLLVSPSANDHKSVTAQTDVDTSVTCSGTSIIARVQVAEVCSCAPAELSANPSVSDALSVIEQLKSKNALLLAALDAKETELSELSARLEMYVASQNEAAFAVKTELQRRAAVRALKQSEIRERVLALVAERDAAITALNEAYDTSSLDRDETVNAATRMELLSQLPNEASVAADSGASSLEHFPTALAFVP